MGSVMKFLTHLPTYPKLHTHIKLHLALISIRWCISFWGWYSAM